MLIDILLVIAGACAGALFILCLALAKAASSADALSQLIAEHIGASDEYPNETDEIMTDEQMERLVRDIGLDKDTRDLLEKG